MSPADPAAMPAAATGPVAGQIADQAIAPFAAPTLCRFVLVRERRTLEPRTFAAVVTAVYSRSLVAVTAFPPAQQPYPIPSVKHESEVGEHDAYSWTWPPRG